MKRFRYLAIRLVPYLAVGLGLYAVKSAWAALVGYHIGMAIVLTLAGQWGQARRIRPGRWGLVLTGSLPAALAGWLLYRSWPGLVTAPGVQAQVQAWGLSGWGWVPFIAYFSLVNPWLEEIYWRGWLGNDARMLVLDDFWFASYHLLILFPFVELGWLMLAWGVLVSAAWGWRQVTNYTGSLFASSLAHVVADFSILLAISARLNGSLF